MTETPITPKSLGKVGMTPLAEDEAALSMITTDQEVAVYLINAEGLAAILPPLLGAASAWAGRPHLENETVFGRGNALQADSAAIARGRHDQECAISLRLGQLELTFLLPLEAAFNACGDLAHLLEPKGDPPRTN